MHINKIKNATRIGQIVVSDKPYSGDKYVLYNHKLKVIYDNSLPKGFVSEHLAHVYFITINHQIYKIGQTSCKAGIKGALGFYCSAGQDDPGQNRFAINYLMREQLKKQNKIEIYVKYLKNSPVSVEGLFGNIETFLVPPSAKILEQKCLSDYVSVCNQLPEWNYQEKGLPIPRHITESFGDYRTKRARGAK
jgi:hypothetical protein